MSDRKSSRVLVVDDDCDILDLLKYNLEKEGFKVKTIENSRKTIRVALEFCPDLIILDLMMPHPNGIEICRELRSIKCFEKTYIFLLTAKSESYSTRCAEYGGRRFGLDVIKRLHENRYRFIIN